MNRLLIIGHTFPEPTTTGAGNRMMEIISMFQAAGYDINFVTTASNSERSSDLKSLGVQSGNILLNDSSFNLFIENLDPDVVIFDRYITEEQFGWRVAETCPNALRILDTEDLHFLRKAREKAIKLGEPQIDIYSETAKRELASILRCDLTLIISEFEMELLKDKFKIPSDLLIYLPFLAKISTSEERKALKKYEDRSDFIFVGNLLHAPNVDAVNYLKEEIWPLIRSDLPNANVHIYGAYASNEIQKFDNPSNGFYIKGWAENIAKEFEKSRINLAPIRFGAGLKSKIFKAMEKGTPTISTTIGAEGINGNLEFSGKISDEPKEFSQMAVSLYQNGQDWKIQQNIGFNLLEKRFNQKHYSKVFFELLSEVRMSLKEHRNDNFIGQIIQHQLLQSTKYLSKWIEAKHQ